MAVLDTEFGKSFRMNNSGPNIDPCGKERESNRVYINLTVCYRHVDCGLIFKTDLEIARI